VSNTVIKKWELFWVDLSPPPYAKDCQCEKYDCSFYLWHDGVGVKSMLGDISLHCTTRLGIATWDEINEALKPVLAERKAKKAALEELRRKEEPPPPKPKKKRRTKKAKEPKPVPKASNPKPKKGRKKLKPRPEEEEASNPLEELGILGSEPESKLKPKRKRRKVVLPPGLGDLNADAKSNAPKKE